jgi:arylsulfatase A-like enzyme
MMVDVFPTVGRWAGARLPGHTIDGKDLGPLLEGVPGARTPHEALFFYYAANELQAIRSGRWKLMLPHTSRTLGGRLGGRGGVPAAYTSEQVQLSLYDLEADPQERTDVAGEQPEVVKRLLGLAEEAREELGDRLQKRTGRGVRQPGRVADVRR